MRSGPPSSAAGSSVPCMSRPFVASACACMASSPPARNGPPSARRQLGIARGYGSLEELLDDDRVEIVHVTSPNHLHHPQVRLILDAGRHVVCEKPLAMTAEESADLVERAASSGKVNAVNFNIRFYPLNQHAHELVATGELGDVRLVAGRYYQDWLLLETDWNWRLEPDRGGRAARGRRHRLALARPPRLHHRATHQLGHGRPGDLHPDPPPAGGSGGDLLDGARGRDARARHRH